MCHKGLLIGWGGLTYGCSARGVGAYMLGFLVVLEGFFSLSRRGCLHVGDFDRIRVNSSRRRDAYMNIFFEIFRGPM